jgi:hypothetical protein
VHLDYPGLYGCDPDPEGVAWCNEHIAEGRYIASGLYPPLPYENESFDAIIAISVMTHLRREVQRIWLAELARILRPGGIFIATLHGDAAAKGFGVTNTGCQDHWLDPFMVGILSADYYRTVLQTEDYTRRSWRQYFDIIAYEAPGLELHDIAVCRKKLLARVLHVLRDHLSLLHAVLYGSHGDRNVTGGQGNVSLPCGSESALSGRYSPLPVYEHGLDVVVGDHEHARSGYSGHDDERPAGGRGEDRDQYCGDYAGGGDYELGVRQQRRERLRYRNGA